MIPGLNPDPESDFQSFWQFLIRVTPLDLLRGLKARRRPWPPRRPQGKLHRRGQQVSSQMPQRKRSDGGGQEGGQGQRLVVFVAKM